jgi:hypothetical protein
MQQFLPHGLGFDSPAAVTRRALCAGGAAMGRLEHVVASFGFELDRFDDIFTALSHLADDPRGYDLFFIDCGLVGGLAAGQRIAQKLQAMAIRLPLVLIEVAGKTGLSDSDDGPIVLTKPDCADAVQRALQCALRNRLHWVVG